MPRRTALIAPVPEAEDAVGAVRLEHDPSAALGAPAHITILVPFVPLSELDQDELAALVASHSSFDFDLASIRRFAEPVTYLAPVPAQPFVELTNAVWRRWPEYPPYEGAFAEVVPHLTVGLADLELELELPIRARVRELLLLAEGDDGRWSEVRRFPLQGVA
jgi:hypothetical protein